MAITSYHHAHISVQYHHAHISVQYEFIAAAASVNNEFIDMINPREYKKTHIGNHEMMTKTPERINIITVTKNLQNLKEVNLTQLPQWILHASLPSWRNDDGAFMPDVATILTS
ncbi:predicted protein [Arabidopsis lyrata subsp. lyrata]|uniref:Predicted protein n=1 Tax=Arabidopsis lyrata subsp. lyrata TaxID=81972 RepID=D7MAL6_ARALL|nr:predicted protein [Arabidopsis lyrata subsp. lyrata]